MDEKLKTALLKLDYAIASGKAPATRRPMPKSPQPSTKALDKAEADFVAIRPKDYSRV